MTDRYALRTYERLFLPRGWLLERGLSTRRRRQPGPWPDASARTTSKRSRSARTSSSSSAQYLTLKKTGARLASSACARSTRRRRPRSASRPPSRSSTASGAARAATPSRSSASSSTSATSRRWSAWPSRPGVQLRYEGDSPAERAQRRRRSTRCTGRTSEAAELFAEHARRRQGGRRGARPTSPSAASRAESRRDLRRRVTRPAIATSCCGGSPGARPQPRDPARGGAGHPRRRRQRPRPVPRAGSRSRSTTCRAGASGSARASCPPIRGRVSRPSTSTPPRRRSTRSTRCSTTCTARVRPWSRDGRGLRGRGLHRRDRAGAGGHRERGRHVRHGAGGGALPRCSAGSRSAPILAFDSDEAGARAAERAFAFQEQSPGAGDGDDHPAGPGPGRLRREARRRRRAARPPRRARPLVEYMLRRMIGRTTCPRSRGSSRPSPTPCRILERLTDPVRRSEYAHLVADLAGRRRVIGAPVARCARAGGRPAARRRGSGQARTAQEQGRARDAEVARLAIAEIYESSVAAHRRAFPFGKRRGRRWSSRMQDAGGDVGGDRGRLETSSSPARCPRSPSSRWMAKASRGLRRSGLVAAAGVRPEGQERRDAHAAAEAEPHRPTRPTTSCSASWSQVDGELRRAPAEHAAVRSSAGDSGLDGTVGAFPFRTLGRRAANPRGDPLSDPARVRSRAWTRSRRRSPPRGGSVGSSPPRTCSRPSRSTTSPPSRSRSS